MMRGDIYWVNLDPTQGAEVQKRRPCLILSSDLLNQARRTVVVVPFSSVAKAFPPVTVEVHCGQQKGVALIDQIRTVDKSRFSGFIEHAKKQDLTRIEQAVKQVLVL